MKRFARISVYLRTFLFYLRYRPLRRKPEKEPHTILLDIRENYYRRYLYTFLKFFHIEGYEIYVRRRLKLMVQLRRDPYANYLLKERLIHFGKPSGKSRQLIIGEGILSPDYFTGIINEPVTKNSFYVPMPQHPLMYHAELWNMPLNNQKRKRSIFMAGNFDPLLYDQIGKAGIFNLISRTSIYEILENRERLYRINDLKALEKFLESSLDQQIILVNRLHFDVPMNKLRGILNQFTFYFALPGVSMPYCHNIVEAMSAGAIPFLQKAYADLFQPALIDGVHVIVFKNSQDLEERLDLAFSLSEEELKLMRQNILAYYHEHATPQSVVSLLESKTFDKIYLQASEYSVSLVK
jgi:hypothetical protein